VFCNNTTKGIIFLPKKKSKTTIIKAPIAHKTFSQEQYGLVYYKLLIRAGIQLKSKGVCKDYLKTKLVNSLYRMDIPNKETNYLFFKEIKIRIGSYMTT